jgi:hypothetical protein
MYDNLYLIKVLTKSEQFIKYKLTLNQLNKRSEQHETYTDAKKTSLDV